MLIGAASGGIGGAVKEAAKIATPIPAPIIDQIGKPAPDLLYLFSFYGDSKSLPPNLLRAIAQVESGGNPKAVNVNKDGSRDYGLMQINERTALTFGHDLNTLYDPDVSIRIASKLLNSIKAEFRTALKRDPTLDELIASYNVGGPTVRRRGIINRGYVDKVKSIMAGYNNA